MHLSDILDITIVETISKWKSGATFSYAALDLLSMGELVDRLTIINIKLYDLKNEVMKRSGDESFLAQAAIKDVALVEERARLKRTIDEKLIAIVTNPNYNPEIKSYGTQFND